MLFKHVTLNSSPQDYTHPDDRTPMTLHVVLVKLSPIGHNVKGLA